ncbi:MAG: NADAR family protein [Planctomycetaceae bacterium]
MHPMRTIRFYRTSEPFGWLSNFAPSPFYTEDGRRWATAEHYFQAQKFAGTPHEEGIRQVESPMEAAQMGRDRSRPLRSDWESVKDAVMRVAVWAKFEQNPGLRWQLIDTGDAEIIEHTENDSYWGDGGDGSGRNMLGRILMEMRAHFRELEAAVRTRAVEGDDDDESDSVPRTIHSRLDVPPIEITGEGGKGRILLRFVPDGVVGFEGSPPSDDLIQYGVDFEVPQLAGSARDESMIRSFECFIEDCHSLTRRETRNVCFWGNDTGNVVLDFKRDPSDESLTCAAKFVHPFPGLLQYAPSQRAESGFHCPWEASFEFVVRETTLETLADSFGDLLKRVPRRTG